MGFFFAVTGVLSYDHVGRFDKRTDLAQLKPEGGFDQGTGVAGQKFFHLVHGKISACAEPHNRGICCAYDLLRHKDAECSDDFSAGLFFIQQFLNAQAMHLAHNKVKVAHAVRAILLCKIYILIPFPQDFKQGIVRPKVHAQIFPHVSVIFAHFYTPHLSLFINIRLFPSLRVKPIESRYSRTGTPTVLP